MANLAKLSIVTDWTALTFTAADLNSLASGGGALSTGTIANQTDLALFLDVSLETVKVGGTTVAASFMPWFLLPLLSDGSTYGDGYASSASAQPALGYWRRNFWPKVGVTSGNAITGMIERIELAPGSYKGVLGNSLTVALYSAAALTLKYRTYTINLNG